MFDRQHKDDVSVTRICFAPLRRKPNAAGVGAIPELFHDPPGPRPSRHVASFAASIAAHAAIVGLIVCFASPMADAGLAIGFSPISSRGQTALRDAAARALERPALRRLMRSAGRSRLLNRFRSISESESWRMRRRGRRRRAMRGSRVAGPKNRIPKSPVWRGSARSRPRDRSIQSMTTVGAIVMVHRVTRLVLIRPPVLPTAPSAPPRDQAAERRQVGSTALGTVTAVAATAAIQIRSLTPITREILPPLTLPSRGDARSRAP